MSDAPTGSQLAVTERGTRLDKFTEDDVNAALRALVLSGGDVSKTVELLADDNGLLVSHDQLRYWRDVAFTTRYYAIRKELGTEVGEQVAGRAMESAIAADEAEKLFISQAVERVADMSPDKLPSAARDMAQVKANNIEKSRLLRDRPTEIKEVRDTGAILDELRRLGILKADPRIDSIEGEATEI
jgi:hypothetical protein